MKKNKTEDIVKLRQHGLTIRQIMKELNISSPSVVQYHLKKDNRIKTWLEKLVILPERFPTKPGISPDNYMIAGFNEYRRILLERIR